MTILATYLIAAFLGAAVGAVEIFQRYRAEPFYALRTRWGTYYVGFNGAMSLVAVWVVQLAGQLADKSDLELLQWAAGCGFGAAAVLRAKLMNLKLSDGKELALGPEIVIQTFLAVLDRELDRDRAGKRWEKVRELFAGIDFDRAKLRLPIQVFQAMQGVTEEETQKLMKGVADVESMTGLDSQDKAYLLGYYLLDLVGDEFLAEVLGKHRDDFVALPPTDAGEPPALPAGSSGAR